MAPTRPHEDASPEDHGERLNRTVWVTWAEGDDGGANARRVRDLVGALRQRGLDVLDERDLRAPPAEGWPHWLVNQLDRCAVILCVCTPTWKRRFEGRDQSDDGRRGSLGGLLITQQIHDNWARNNRILPLLWHDSDRSHVPAELRAWVHWRVPRDVDDVATYCHGARHALPQVQEALVPEANALTVDITVEGDRWRVSALGDDLEMAPPDLAAAIAPLRGHACRAFACDAEGRLLEPGAGSTLATMLAHARGLGEQLATVLPPRARDRLRTLMLHTAVRDGAPGGGAYASASTVDLSLADIHDNAPDDVACNASSGCVPM